MLKGKQKKLDKNNNGRIDAEDFKLLKGSKKGMRMGGMMYADDGGFMDYYSNTPKVDKKNLDRAGKGVGELVERIMMPPAAAIRDTGKAYKEFKKMQKRKQNKKDVEQIEAKKGKMIKAKKGKYLDKYERGLDFHPDPLVRSGKMSRDTYDAVSKGMDLGLGALGVLGTGVVGFAANEARKAGKKADKRKKMRKEYIKSKGSMTQGSFRVGGLSRQRLDSISAHKNKQAQMKKEKQKEENIRKTEISPMGAKKGKMIKAKTGKSVDTIKITPTIKGKPLKARPFMKSKFDSGVRSRDYKFSKK